MRTTRKPLIEPTIEQCKTYLESHVQPADSRFVCWLNIAESMQSEASIFGVHFDKASLKDRIQEAAKSLGYVISGIDLNNAAYRRPKEGNV